MKIPRTVALLLLLIVGGGVGVGVFRARTSLAPPPAAPGLSSPPPEEPRPLPPNLPALEESDEFFRGRAASLSGDAALREWLKSESLIPRLTAILNRIAHGAMPRELLSAFAPRGKFKIAKKDGKAYADPASHSRYERFASMIRSIDAAAAAKTFEELEPLFDAAQRSLGDGNATARGVLAAAIGELSRTPMPAAAELTESKKGLLWAYADEKLEGLSLAQKQLLRMGPKNQAAVQDKLREISAALRL